MIAWPRARRKRLALPIRLGDLYEIQKLLKGVSFLEALETIFVRQHAHPCWTLMALYSCNTLHGKQTSLAPGPWTAAEKRVVEAVRSSVDRSLRLGWDVRVDAAETEKDVKLARLSFAGEEVGTCHKLSRSQILPALPPLGPGGCIDFFAVCGAVHQETVDESGALHCGRYRTITP